MTTAGLAIGPVCAKSDRLSTLAETRQKLGREKTKREHDTLGWWRPVRWS